MTEEEGCNCGCGLDRATAVRQIAHHENLNYDQADARLSEANRIRRENGLDNG